MMSTCVSCCPGLENYFWKNPGQVLFYLDAPLKAYLLNLDRGIEILQGCYSKDFGRPAVFDPVDMLRSLILMVSLKITCVTKWADDLTKSDVLAILCGFEPGKTPSASAFYDFWNRLWLEDKRLRKKRKLRIRIKSKQPKNVQKGQKLPNRRPGGIDSSGLSVREDFSPPNVPSGCCRSCSPGSLFKAPGIEILSLFL
ncbi:MAG: transposase [Bacillota bacterium]